MMQPHKIHVCNIFVMWRLMPECNYYLSIVSSLFMISFKERGARNTLELLSKVYTGGVVQHTNSMSGTTLVEQLALITLEVD